jgi:hypothetical protein
VHGGNVEIIATSNIYEVFVGVHFVSEVPIGITGFLDFVHRPAFKKNTKERNISDTGSISVLR